MVECSRLVMDGAFGGLEHLQCQYVDLLLVYCNMIVLNFASCHDRILCLSMGNKGIIR